MLNVNSEYIVWKTIHNWVNFEKTNRLEHLPDLIYNCLRFGRLDKHFIDVFIFECDLFMELSNAVQCGLKDFTSAVLQNCKQTTTYNFSLFSSSCDLYFRQRGAHSSAKIEYLLVCIDREKGLAEFYDNHHHSWHVSPVPLNLPNNQDYFRLALIGTEQSVLYAFGGWKSGHPTKLVWGRDLSDSGSSYWTAMANMNYSRCAFASVILNDNIYVLGGKNRENDSFQDFPIRSCERYTSQLNQWLTVTPMNSPRVDASAAVLNGCIYIAGGESGEGNERSVEKYDPKLKKWKLVAPTTTARIHLALTPFAGRLWATGGLKGDSHQPLCSCESYDPVTDTWREELPMNVGRRGHAAIEFNRELYVVGGREAGKLIRKN